MNRELASVYARLDLDDFDVSTFSSLTTLIVENAEDAKIWTAVLELITDLSRRTPPTKSIPQSFFGTPFTRSSAEVQGSKQTRSDLAEPLVNELDGCVFEDVAGFWAKYFEGASWSQQYEKIDRKIKEQQDNDFLKDFPQNRIEENVWRWLDEFQQRRLKPHKTSGVYHRTKSKGEVTGAQGDRQLDLIIKHRGLSAAEKHDAKDFRVIGELTTSSKSTTWKKKFSSWKPT